MFKYIQTSWISARSSCWQSQPQKQKKKWTRDRVQSNPKLLLLPSYTNLNFSSHTRDVSWPVAPGKPAKRPSGKTGAAQVTAWRSWKRQPPIAIRQCIPSQPDFSIFADAFCFFSGFLNGIVFLTRVSGMVVRWCFLSIFQVSNCLAPVDPVGGCQTIIIQPSG